jgi:hypothetical protein
MVSADSEAVASDELEEITELVKVLGVLSATVECLNVDSDIEKALAMDLLWCVAEKLADVKLSELMEVAADFYGHKRRFALTIDERGQLLRVLTRLKQAKLIMKREDGHYGITADGWLKAQEAKRAAKSRSQEVT